MSHFDFLPSSPPDVHEWEYRRKKYDAIWMNCIHENGSTSNQHTDGLKWELERCFCSGSWIAVVILSAAIVEVHLSNIGKWKKSDDLLNELNIKDEWSWLKGRRNYLVHGEQKTNSRLPTSEYRREREKLQRDGERSIMVALKVALE